MFANIWLGLTVIWLLITFILSFTVGLGVILLPLLPNLATILKRVSLYELLSWPGFAYAVLMGLIGFLLFFYKQDPLKKPDKAGRVIGVLGGVIGF